MAYDSEKAYVDRDKYLEFDGIDLDIEFKSSQYDNPTQVTATRIKNITRQMYMKITHDFEITEWDDDTFTEALLWQIKHVLKHGDDGKLDEMAYALMHESGMINPSSQARSYRVY